MVFIIFLAQICKTPLQSANALICELKSKYMIIKNLFSLFGGSYQTGRSDNALPNVIEEKESKVIIPEKFKDDIERLTKYGVELKSGLCIELELSELLEILPRARRRKDSYDKLAKFLADEMNIKLIIKSRNYDNKKETSRL